MKLGVNIDHVATLREARKGKYPEPVLAAQLAEVAGADSIVAHLREDRRHIKERDIRILKEVIKTKLNMEMSVAPDIVRIACEIKPQQCTLVPEKRQELTTEGGLDVKENLKIVKQAVGKLTRYGIMVSLFIDPDINQINASKNAGVTIVELHTGRFALAKHEKEREKYLEEIKIAAVYARDRGFQVFAGHGLDYSNVKDIAAIDAIEELNIGYSIICRSVYVGIEEAVR